MTLEEEKEILFQKYTEANNQLMAAKLELEAANQKLKEYEEKVAQAEKASKMKSLFLANMSHEIRTPLNAIEGFSRIIAETDSAEERQTFLEIIETNNNRLLSLVDEILDLSRVEAGEITIKKETTDLEHLMKSIKQLFKFRCPDTVALSWTHPDTSVLFTTDENRLAQIFSNLISNALKHTTMGSVTYGYRLIDDAKNIEFYVTDTGTGIASEFIPHIFDTYTSKDAESQKGFGLGLALCRIIVEKMGGHIEVHSELGHGATFTFVLPFQGTVGGVSTSMQSMSNGRTLRAIQRSDGTMKTILVAEDEEPNFELVRIVLHNRYRILRAHNGIEAVTINEDEKPDLILMDIRMPEMNGLDATRIIKEVNHETPVIAISAFAYDEHVKAALTAGCNDFLAKPFNPEELIEMVKKHIGDED